MSGKSPDWGLIRNLRALYHKHSDQNNHSNGKRLENYWSSHDLLYAYDCTLAKRIGWKWDAVLGELKEKIQFGNNLHLLDFACGTGIASRRFLYFFGSNVDRVSLFDRSDLAQKFAVSQLRSEGAQQALVPWQPDAKTSRIDILLLSHVINELAQEDRHFLLQLVRKADFLIWVEPGTFRESRDLIDFRHKLLGEFEVVTPCSHQKMCGLTANDREGDWCHFFAPSPPEVFHTRFWDEASKQLGFDRRSLPLSYLCMRRKDALTAKYAWIGGQPSPNRLIGRAKVARHELSLLNCSSEGVSNVKVQKKTDKAQFKRLASAGFNHHWEG